MAQKGGRMVVMARTGMAGAIGWMGVLNGSEEIEGSFGSCRSYTYGGHHDCIGGGIRDRGNVNVR